MTHADDLRAWARGMYTTEAAMELLLRAFRGKFAAPGNPWVYTSAEAEGPSQVRARIDFAAIPDEVGRCRAGSAVPDVGCVAC